MAGESDIKKFRHSLGPRIDAWEVIRCALERHEADAENRARQTAQGMVTSIPSSDFPEIFEAVAGVVECPVDELLARMDQLLKTMRDELADPAQTMNPVLLFGSDVEFLLHIRHELELYGYEAIVTEQDDLALEAIATRKIAFIVLHAENALRDGSHRVALLRGGNQKTSIPIIAIVDRDLGVPPVGLTVGVGGDQCLARPIEPKTVAKYIHARIRGRVVYSSVTRQGEAAVRRNLLELSALAVCYEKLREQVEASVMPSALGIITIGAHYDWDAEPEAEEARKAIFAKISAMLCTTFRWSDSVARLDGNSFVILFPGEESAGGCCALDKALTLLRERNPFPFKNMEFTLSVEAGLSPIEAGFGFDDTVRRARQSVETTRQQGRNRILCPAVTKQVKYKKNIMVLADGFSGQMICQLLEKAGFNPVALDAARFDQDPACCGLRFSLVLIDEEFSGKRGIEFLQGIRARRQFNRTPVVMLCSTEEGMRHGADAGANEQMRKPYAPEGLLASIRSNLSRGRGMGSGTSGHAILVVDPDVPALVAAGSVLCRNGGFRVLLARSGWEGIRRMRTPNLDCVLFCMDVTDIPRDDLFRLIPQQMQSLGKMRVVLSSKTPGMVTPNMAIGLGVKGIIPKPYKLQSLVDELSTLLGVPARAVVHSPHEKELQSEIARILESGWASGGMSTVWDKSRGD